MKKLFLLLIAVLVVCCGCGEKENETTNNETTNNESVVTEVKENSQQESSVNSSSTQTGTSDEYSKEELENNWETFKQYDEESANSIKEAVSNISVSESSDKYVIKQSDNMVVTYYHNGKEITGNEARITYDSAEEALAAKASYEYDEEDNIDSVRVEGKDVIVKFTPEEYKDMTLDEVKQVYDLFNVIQGN